MREFVTAVQTMENDQGTEEEPNEFSLDGVLCQFYQPQDGQVAVLMASTGKHSSEQEQVAAFINFFVGVLDDDTHTYIVSKLLNRKDPFGLAEVQEILEYMMEVWSGNPTQSFSASTPSPKPVGRRSTPRTTKSTSSASRSTGS
jgi:hypothetical protein